MVDKDVGQNDNMNPDPEDRKSGAEAVAEARKSLGRQLAAHREAAGLIQEQLARMILYGRSTVANAEAGYSNCSRTFWERCDRALDAGGAISRGYAEFKALKRRYQTQVARRLEADRSARYRQIQSRLDQGAGANPLEESDENPHQTTIPADLPWPTSTPSGQSRSDDGEPWTRLTYAVKHPERTDERAVEQLEWYTAEMFRREECLPSRQLITQVRAHVARLDGLLVGTPKVFERRLLTTIGEALALAGWLAWDCGEVGEADRLLTRASDAAHQAQDGPLLACILAYRSYAAESDANLTYARELLVAAQRCVRSRGSATTRAWLAAREAEIGATIGEETPALRALDRAMTAYDYAHPYQERAWTAFLTPSRLGGMSITAHARLDHPDLAAVTDSVLTSLQAADFKKVIVLADVSAAALQRGRYDQAAAIGHEAIDQLGARRTRLIEQRLDKLHGLLTKSKRSVPALTELGDRLLAHLS